MSCKLGSKYVCLEKEEYLRVDMDEKARIVTPVPEWNQPAPSPSTGVSPGGASTYVNRSFSVIDKRAAIPGSALELVTTGALTTGFAGHTNYMSTIGCAFKVSAKLALGKDKFARAQLWDTAGQERFRTIGRAYSRGAQLAFIVYDISSSYSGTVTNLARWVEEVRQGNEDCVVVILGNKLDLEDNRQVASDSVQQYADEQGLFFQEVSAKSGQNLERAFARAYSQAYMYFWQREMPFELIKVIILGDSGVGKTALFDRLEGFAVDMSPLTTAYPIDGAKPEISSTKTQPEKQQPAPQEVATRPKLVRPANTNVISLNLGLLGAWSDKCRLATGDPELCSTCGSVLSMYSKIEDNIFVCDFCCSKNEVHLEKEEVPQTSAVDYLERDTPSLSQTTMEDDSIVVFCLDTSGSMTVTTPIAAQEAKKLKRKEPKDNADVTRTAHDATSQYLPREARNVSYISRLEAVQFAVESQLVNLQQEHPNRPVALVTFATDVTVYGDGQQLPTILSGDRLNSVDELEDISRWWHPQKGAKAALPSAEPAELTGAQKAKLANATTKQEILEILSSQTQPVSSKPEPSKVEFSLAPVLKTRLSLSEKLFKLEEVGQTSLGPALVVSCAIAAQKPGSKVVLCTDGLANVGVGSMDAKADAESFKEFYQGIAKKALHNNTTISLMGFKGSDSNFEVLGEMVTKTGGQADKVDPAEVSQNFKSIFADDTVATNVSIKLYMPEGVYLQATSIQMDDWAQADEKAEKSKGRGCNIYSKTIGSINSDSNLLVQYAVDSLLLQQDLQSVSFQFQITYTRAEDGKKLMRAISLSVPICKTTQDTYKDTDLEVLGLNAVRTVANTAQKGQYTKARLQNYAHLQLMKQVCAASSADDAKDILKSYLVHNKKFEHSLLAEQLKEIAKGKSWDDTETEMSELAAKYPQAFAVKSGGVENFLVSNISSFISWLMPSSATTTTTSTTSPTEPVHVTREPKAAINSAPIVQDRAAGRTDEISNVLWNMRGANML